MRLHATEFLRHLSGRPMTFLAEHGIRTLPPRDRNRQSITAVIRPMVHRAGKFIFDSGVDADTDTTQAVKDTALAMIEDRRFHLPYPTTWIEDPFETDPTGEFRNYYLAYEMENQIRVWRVYRPPEDTSHNSYICAVPLIIDLAKPHDGHTIPIDIPAGHPGHNPRVFSFIRELLSETDYAFRKFIVTLGSGGVEREDVVTERSAAGGNSREGSDAVPTGRYNYTIIRIPNDMLFSDSKSGTGRRRRRHFVRGFVWGKNTRPREEQRWVAGYYRGSAELGETERSHYEMRATKA